MKLHRKILGVVAAVAMVGLAENAPAQTEIQWWHAMGGARWARPSTTSPRVNNSQTDYVVKAVYKGNYTETMTASIAAFRSHMMQVFEVGLLNPHCPNDPMI